MRKVNYKMDLTEECGHLYKSLMYFLITNKVTNKSTIMKKCKHIF